MCFVLYFIFYKAEYQTVLKPFVVEKISLGVLGKGSLKGKTIKQNNHRKKESQQQVISKWKQTSV